ncbi:hydrogen cyanide synthase subunit HcnC precursor [mine drainage metagenome]|uniref:Hydrogen cyanide synthase subunit HcnC n=1 Tax=mine drainage metagenome TaxID=410659 RepID=A0A1J5QYV4_9ZZZZ
MRRHAVIIGAGVVGCLSALALVERGWRVTLIDRGTLGGEASWAGGGILFPLLPWNYSDPVNRLALAGAARHPELCEQLRADTGIDPQYQACGMRILPPFDLDRAQRWCRAYGISAEPQADTLWLPSVSQLRNPRLMRALGTLLTRRGVSLVEHAQLIPLPDNTERLVEWRDAQGRVFAADAFVLAAGAWSQTLLGCHAPSLQMKPMRGQMLLYQLAPGTLTHMLYREDFYLIPRQDGRILAGSTVEDVGFDKSTTPAIAAELAAKAAALLPQLAGTAIIRHWSGLRPGSPDNVPVIARHPRFDNLFLNTGHFRYGVTMAPASAEILAGLMCGETPILDPAPYAFPA